MPADNIAHEKRSKQTTVYTESVTKLDYWQQAFTYAKRSGLAADDASDFADNYAAYIDDRAYENYYPDRPLSTPSEFIP